MSELNELHRVLLELQTLDREIAEGVERSGVLTDRMGSLNAPVAALEAEEKALRKQASVLDHHARTLERTAQEKRARLTRYQEHIDRARTQREAEAARTELKDATAAINVDEEQALEKMLLLEDVQAQLAALQEKLASARAEEEAARRELMSARDAELQGVELLRARREEHARRAPARARSLYERMRGTNSNKTVIAPLTETGACGHCFNTLPVQEQSTVRHGTALHHCEACGVVLSNALDAESRTKA